jgi:hypothetical protein
MCNHSTVAAVLHGALDIHIEHRSPLQLAPGEAQVEMMATGLCGSDRQYCQLLTFSTSLTRLFQSITISTAEMAILSSGHHSVSVTKPAES